MRDKIIVVGGYGQVGRHVSLELAKRFPQKVIVAGRSIDKANRFAGEHNGQFETLQLDIYDAGHGALENAKAAVMCLSPASNDFANFCIEKGVHYIDISPSNGVAQGIEPLQEKAEQNNVTCVLGVGLASGLSNLLVKELRGAMDALEEVNIHLMLGLGDSHGEDGVRWLLDNMGRDFVDGSGKRVKPFVDKRKTAFMAPLGERSAYRFNLADQFIAVKTLQTKQAASYFCYDSRAITALVSILQHLGAFRLLRYKSAYRATTKLFGAMLSALRKLGFGTDVYSIKIDAVGMKNGNEHFCHAAATGHDNALFTAKVAAFVAREMYAGHCPPGVFYMEQLFSLDDLADICPEIEADV